ncbi:threonine--tRNA ligase [Candidatus Comchoanobacter bicostacola]|uniref:Threonine--tRNA ligase n=1 Tax=Candidatus Comchoanobacter bicostacola TaxID=2919598 RepID=A0ABY5DJZ0_9GAMM|nr:threonine--tRNA ligase [Candidatus Comchoanobacter bicostacola]UTC24117.1 threonine--tRNA ligase [Candidatus Comchoanobacter bicostacola]
MKTAFEYLQQADKKTAKKAVVAKLEGELIDLSREVAGAEGLEPIMADSPEGVGVIRHSTAHLLAMAVKELYANVQVTIGPVIEEGFYYDFAFSDDTKLTPEDFQKIEKQMQRIVKKNLSVERSVLTKSEAVKYFQSIGEDYKVQIINDLPEGETLTLYGQGDFKDLCRGPHVRATAQLGAFKLTKVAGAYWRGDSNNPMLQRVYGTAWPDQESLSKHLEQLKEREKRNHKRIAAQADLFHFQPEAPGMVFWHPKGWFAYQQIISFIRDYYKKRGYQEVNTPMVLDRSLWEASGHWDKFQDNMFEIESDKRQYAVKPMNCPGHVQVFNDKLRSYRDLPLRLAEFGTCHRNEPSGTLQGLMRLRAFVQDDGHVFCSEDDLASEVGQFVSDALEIYKRFGFDDVSIKFSTRPDERVGDDKTWDHSESVLETILNDLDIDWTLSPGEGAFYGPKLELNLKDSLGRVWQCGTVQLDFSMPERLGASYINSSGEKCIPVMVHRAMLGSLERFMGILIENTAGWLPIWMQPVQVLVLGISDKHSDCVDELVQRMSAGGIRAETDRRAEKINLKIREHTLARVPIFAVVGDQEVENKTVSIRLGEGKRLGAMTVEELVAYVKNLEEQ